MMKALTRAAAFGLMAAAVVGSVALLPGRGAAVSLHKAVLAGGQLYAVQVAGSTGAAADAIGLQVSGADVRRMVLPTQLSPPALTVPWDITSSAWFLVAFIDIVPGQRSCQLAKVGLSDLGPSGAMPPTPASRVPRFSDLITHVPPLSMAVAAAQAQGAGPVFADIVVLGDKQVELYIAAGKTMSMFEYGGAAWSGKWRVPRESAAPFVAVRSGETTYLVTEQGTISTHTGDTLQTLATLPGWSQADGAGAVKLVVQDRDRGEVLFARAAAGQGAGSALSVHALRGSEVGAASVAASTGEAMERLCRLVSAGP